MSGGNHPIFKEKSGTSMISKVKRKAEISRTTDKLKSGLGASFVRVVESKKQEQKTGTDHGFSTT